MHSLSVFFAALALTLVAIQGGAEPLRVAQAASAGEEPEPTTGGQRPSRPRDRGGIEEIVVQAGESDAVADLQVGDSVTGFDASDLEALGAQSIEDLAGFTPNLEIVTSGATTPTFFIRGVGLNDFNPNSTGSVAIYQDDVPKNAPALQLSTLFDVEAVNILRGPQGTGPFRAASAGAIKVYSRKPSGEFGGYLRSEIGNYDSRDFEGAVEMPLFEDMLTGRFAFRYSIRDGYADNRCGGAPPYDQRPVNTTVRNNMDLIHVITPQVVAAILADTGTSVSPGASTCGERNFRGPRTNPNGTVTRGLVDAFVSDVPSDGISDIVPFLQDDVNNRDNWAGRGMLRFQPTLDQDWLLTGHYSKRNEYSRLGQAYGTGQASGNTHWVCDFDKLERDRDESCAVAQTWGSEDGADYQGIDVFQRLYQADPCTYDWPVRQKATRTGIVDRGKCPGGSLANDLVVENSRNAAEISSAHRLSDWDKYPHEGDYNHVGRTKNDVWGFSLKGDVALGDSMQLRSVTGYDDYDRFIDTDLDFSPNTLFQIATDDEGWQFVQDLELSGSLSQELPVGWNLGGFMLVERLAAPDVNLDFPFVSSRIAVVQRDWEQDLVSLAGFAGFDWDFWDDFTLDGGFRYNWERKTLDLTTFQQFQLDNQLPGVDFSEEDVWQDPTGQIRLTYRFREDTHAYWKYTRGWKGGHYNVTANQIRGITIAEPETIDSFEVGIRGSWFNGRLSLDTSLFHYDYEDYQIFTVQIPLVGNPEFVVLNANDAEVYGGEADLVARPLPGMFLQARFSWLESNFIDFVQTQALSIVEGNQRKDVVAEIDNSGNSLLNSPEFKISLTAEQTLPLGRFGSLTARWDGAWTDDTYYDASEGRGAGDFNGNLFLPDNTIGQEAFWLHNLRLDYRTPDGSVTIGAWVRNLDDEVYKNFGFDASPLAINRTTIFFLGDPRTYGGSMTVTF